MEKFFLREGVGEGRREGERRGGVVGGGGGGEIRDDGGELDLNRNVLKVIEVGK